MSPSKFCVCLEYKAAIVMSFCIIQLGSPSLYSADSNVEFCLAYTL